jgi:hypothetical protein
MFTFLKKLVGGQSAAQGAKPITRQAKPELETLDQRLVPSTIPNLKGFTLHLDGPSVPSSRILIILSERDNGNGTGTFQGIYESSKGIDVVDGIITLKHAGPGTFENLDFQLRYSSYGGWGWAGGWASVVGGGDFRCSTLNPSGGFSESSWGPSWVYSGWSMESWSGETWSNWFEGIHGADGDWPAPGTFQGDMAWNPVNG